LKEILVYIQALRRSDPRRFSKDFFSPRQWGANLAMRAETSAASTFLAGVANSLLGLVDIQ
jgi:hypothetical protein